MNYKGTYLDQNLSSSFPSTSTNGNFQNMYNNPNFPFNASNMNFNNLNSNSNTMNNNMNSFNNMNGMNTMSMNYNSQNNGFMNHFPNQNQPMNQGYGTLSSSIPQTFSSRTNTNNYNPSDYINDNFLNKVNNYKPYVNDFSNTTTKVNQNMNAATNNANVTIKRNRKDFLDAKAAKATIQSKMKKNSSDAVLIESDNENEENEFLVKSMHKNYSYEKNDFTKKEKSSGMNDSNNDNLQNLINQIKNIIHS